MDEYYWLCLTVETNNSIFHAHAKKRKQKTQISIEWKKKIYIWRNDELNIDNTLETKIKTKMKTKIKKKNQNQN